MIKLQQLQEEAQHSILTYVGITNTLDVKPYIGWALKTLDVTSALIDYTNNPTDDNLKTVIEDFRSIIIYPLEMILNATVDRIRELGLKCDVCDVNSHEDPIEEKRNYIKEINRMFAKLETATNIPLPPLKLLEEIKNHD